LLETITPVILTFNEAANISRTLERLSWARKIIVLDSGSLDGTRGIVESYSNTHLFQRKFDSHSKQWNFAISNTGIDSEWILALDADHVLTDELTGEIAGLRPQDNICGYRVQFIYCVQGQRLRGSLYPPLISLYRRGHADYVQQGHTQRLRVDGDISQLKGHMLHDDRKPINEWFAAQQRYMKLEAHLIQTTPWRNLSISNRMRRLILPAPIAVLFWCLFVKGTLFDGLAGVIYSAQRVIAECMLSLQLVLPQQIDFSESNKTNKNSSGESAC